MAKSRNLEDCLAALAELRASPAAAATREALRAAIADRTNLVAARAATIVGDCQIGGLEDELSTAFTHFMQHPSKSDKGCVAKAAIWSGSAPRRMSSS